MQHYLPYAEKSDYIALHFRCIILNFEIQKYSNYFTFGQPVILSMDYDTEGVAFSNFEYWQICYNETSKQIGKTHNP